MRDSLSHWINDWKNRQLGHTFKGHENVSVCKEKLVKGSVHKQKQNVAEQVVIFFDVLTLEHGFVSFVSKHMNICVCVRFPNAVVSLFNCQPLAYFALKIFLKALSCLSLGSLSKCLAWLKVIMPLTFIARFCPTLHQSFPLILTAV